MSRTGRSALVGWWVVASLLTAGVVYLATPRGLLELAVAGAIGGVAILLMVSDLRLALVMAVVSIPLEDFFIIGSAGTVTKLVIIGLTGSYVLHLLRGRLRPRWRALAGVGWLWTLWAAASMFWSDVPQVGQVTSLVQLVVLAFLVAGLIAERPELLPTALWSYAASACAIAALGVVRFFSDLQSLGPVRTSAGEAQGVEHFAAYLLPALVFLIVYLLGPRIPWQRRLPVAALVVLLAFGMLVSGTRSAWMGAVAALLVVVVPQQRPRQTVMLVALVLAVAVGASQLPGVGDFVMERAATAVSGGGSGRVDIWKVGAAIAAQAPVIGVGFSNFPTHFGVNEIRNAPFALEHMHLYIGRAPHSIYVGNLVELGLVGLTLWIAWVLPLVLSLQGRGTYMLAIRGAFIAYMVQGMYLDILNRKYFWLFLGLAEGCRLILARREVANRDDVAELVVDEPLPELG